MPPVLALLGALVFPQAQAQETITLVSNIHISASTWDRVKKTTPLRQRFTTGSYPTGYAITKVKVDSFQLNENDNPRIRIYSDDSGSLGSSLHTFSNPSSYNFASDNTFTIDSAQLNPDTSYWLVFEARRDSVNQDGWRMGRTTSNSQRVYNHESWNIEDTYEHVEDGVVSTKNYSLIFRLQGTVTNTAATGTPTISGTAHSGEELRAHTGSVADANGIDGKRYQWLRVASDDTETPIIGSGSSTYRLTGFDAGKRVKVRVYFEDEAGYDEQRFSAAFPASGTIDNTAPTGSDGFITMDEDVPYAFKVEDFDLEDADQGNSLGSVTIVSLPAKGTLTNDGDAVTAGQIIPIKDISQNFVYTPAENEYGEDYTSFEFKVGDGGADSADAYTMGINVNAVNDPATGSIAVSGGDAYVGIRVDAHFVLTSIRDVEGLTSPDFQYQWMRVTIDDEGNIVSRQDIRGATKSGYTIKPADLGKKVQYRISFYDDEGNPETLESSLHPISRTETIDWLPLRIGLSQPPPYTVERANGVLNYLVIVNSTYEFYMSSRNMREHVLTVENGSIVKTKRLDRRRRFVNGRLRSVGKRWQLEVAPTDPTQEVVVTYTDRACDERGAICSFDGVRYLDGPAVVRLSTDDNSVPLSVSISDATGDEGETMLFNLVLSRGSRNIVKVVVQTTAEGTATAGDDFEPVEHTLILNRTRVLDGFNVVQHKIHPVAVKIHADSDDDDAETIVVEIVKADVVVKGRRIPITVTDSKATGTITDVDPDTVTLPEISVADATAEEGTDESVDFVISLDLVPTEIVRVDYSIRSGTATARQDFGVPVNGFDGTLCFLPSKYTPGETCRVGTSQTISVPIMDDAVDEGSETLTLRLRNPSNATISDAEAIGTITNDDPLQTMWLSRFGRTVGGQVVDAVAGRLSGPAPGSQVTLGGESIDLSASLPDGADARDSLGRALGAAQDNDPEAGGTVRSMTGRELLLGSSFHLAAGEAGGAGYAAWGRIAVGGFDAEAPAEKGDVRLDGKVTTGILGADAQWERWLAGVALSLSEGEGSFDQPGVDTGTVESSLASVTPYVRYQASDRLSVWGLLGYGTGDMTMTQAARSERTAMVTRTDISMRLGAAGARSVLLKADEDGGIDLALRGDAFLVQMHSEKAANTVETKADASRLRLVLETGRPFALGPGAVLTPTLELGLRHDGGDAETGTGVELGGRIRYTDAGSGLTVEANARKLIAHEDSGYEEWGAGGSVRLDPGASGRGLSLSLAPVWGTPSSGVERLWSARDAAGLVRDDDFEAERRLEGEVGYGLGAFGERGVVTPYAGLGLAEAGDRTWRAGARWSLAPHLAMSLDGARREPANDDAPEHGVQFRLTLRW